MQRRAELGTRNVLTEEEFKQAQERFAQQAARDEAEFDLEASTSTPGGDVGGPVSPPPHWLERGNPQYIASLIVDPPDGRHAAADRRGADAQPGGRRRAQAVAARAGRLVHRSQPLRPLHHPRHRRLVPAGHLQQRQPDRPGARIRRPDQRDDPRDPHRPARRPAAAQPVDHRVHGRFTRLVGRQHAGGRDDQLQRAHVGDFGQRRRRTATRPR